VRKNHNTALDSVGARIGALVKALGYDRRMAEFAKSVGLKSREHVSRLISGAVKPTETLVLAICFAHGVNREWLEHGKGEMYADSGDAAADRAGYTSVPLYSTRLAAGAGAEVYSERTVDELLFKTEWLHRELRATVRGLVAMLVQGDSMEPTLSAGDVVLIDCTVTDPHRGDIFAVRIDDSLLIKRIRKAGRDHYILHSDNDAYDDIPFPWPAPIHRAQIIGRVVWAGKKL